MPKPGIFVKRNFFRPGNFPPRHSNLVDRGSLILLYNKTLRHIFPPAPHPPVPLDPPSTQITPARNMQCGMSTSLQDHEQKKVRPSPRPGTPLRKQTTNKDARHMDTCTRLTASAG